MSSTEPVARAVRATLLASLAAVLFACAGVPGNRAYKPVGLPSDSDETTFNTGRLAVYVTDQNGRPISNARVDVDSSELTYRNSGLTDRIGRITFSGVPQEVNVAVSARTGFYSHDFVVSPYGTSEMRMIVQMYESVEEPVPGTSGDPSPGTPPTPVPRIPGR